MADRTNSIEVEGLVREFKNGPRAVDGIDLRVEPGTVYGFLGPNGAGKSTTVHMLTTLLPPTSGSARVAGYDVATEGAHVRAAIGAALQEAALDPLLTGREHLRLQASLQALPRGERNQRADELIARVGLSHAADRKVRGYSGGMKRRLDLAMALVHRPSVLFLDEPTTGLDIQSRTALWEEVARLAREDRVTVFLTTQYLEEADVLADRVGIIDHGHIVAEGTPADLKASVGRPTVKAVPAAPSHRDGARLNQFADQVYLLARRSVVRTVRQPANVISPLVFPMLLLAVNAGGLKAETRLPGFPTNSFVAFALAVPFIQGALFATMNAGTDLARDIQTGFLNRLSLTPMRRLAVLAGQLGGVVTLGLVQAVVYLSVGLLVGVHVKSGVLGVLVLLAFAILVALGFGALGAFAALRTGSGEAVQGLFPAFFVFLFLSSMNIPRDLIEITWFRDVATANPVSYLLECVRSLVITGWDGQALALGFGLAAAVTVASLGLASWALKVRMAQ